MSDLADGQLRGWRRFWVRLHLAVCPPCRKVHRSFGHTLDLLHELGEEPPPADAERDATK